jgi:hypothetical protein
VTDMTTEQAVDIMAADLLRALLDNHGGGVWEDYPDIGENDWASVLERAKAIVGGHGSVDTVAAYEHLAARAAAWEASERGDDGTR